jgi:hypothetical protein
MCQITDRTPLRRQLKRQCKEASVVIRSHEGVGTLWLTLVHDTKRYGGCVRAGRSGDRPGHVLLGV